MTRVSDSGGEPGPASGDPGSDGHGSDARGGGEQAAEGSGEDRDAWPLQPWMAGCDICVRMRVDMIEACTGDAEPEVTAYSDWPVLSQFGFAEHVTKAHPGVVPEWFEGCETCAYYRGRVDRDPEDRLTGEKLGPEHRARHLLVPPSIATRA